MRYISLLLLICTACHPTPTGNNEVLDDWDPEIPRNVWSPTPGTTWAWQLTGEVDTSIDVEMYDVDLFDTPTNTIEKLQEDGRIVICYFSAGSHEDWREDAGEFVDADYGRRLRGWDGERWLDIRSENVRRIMRDRMDLAVDKGCDGVEPDNVDGFDNRTGLDLSRGDQLAYNAFLSDEAHARGLSVGLKNAVGLVELLQPGFDWALNEECRSYGECSTLRPFLDADKAVFHVEYVDEERQGPQKANEICGDVPTGFSTLIKTWELDRWFLECS